MAFDRSLALLPAFLLAVCLASLSPVASAQQEGRSGKLSAAAQASAEAQEKQIVKESRRLRNHPWAGQYYYGDGLGVNVSLALAPDAGFVFTWHGCLGLYDLNYGKVELVNGKVRLVFTYPNTHEGFEGIASEFVPVRWGERHYLIPPDGMIEFANAVNAGLEPSRLFGGRSRSFLLRVGDETKKVVGWPDIPEPYDQYLLKSPIRAAITAVRESQGKDEARRSTVMLDAGGADGVKLGMELHVYSPSTVVESVTVTKVYEHSAEAKMCQTLLQDPPPAVGWKVSTDFHEGEKGGK